MQAGAGIADLRAGDERRPVAEACRRRRAAGALRDVLVDLAVLVRARPKTFDRGDDHARIELVDVLPGEPHAVERARREILDQHVALLDQAIENGFALGMFGIDGDRTLRAVEHREIEAVGAFHVAQLAARDVADAWPFNFDDIGAHVSKELGAGRPRLHMREVEDFHAFERPARLAPRFGGRPRQTIAVCFCAVRLCRRLLRLQFDDFCGRLLRRGFCFGGLRFALGFLFRGQGFFCSHVFSP